MVQVQRLATRSRQLLRALATLAHRTIWQRLPHAARRRLFVALTARFAPRADLSVAAAPPTIVAGALGAVSGLGQSARLSLAALAQAHLQHAAIDLTAELMQPSALPIPQAPQADKGAGTLVLHVNGPLVPLALVRLGRARVAGKYIIGYWAWELQTVPDEWRSGVACVHEIWTPSTFTADAIRPIAAGLPVRVVPHPVAAITTEGKHASPRDATADKFRVLTVFSAANIARKNPLAAVAAFRAAFAQDTSVELVIKISEAHLWPNERGELTAALAGAGNIRVIDTTLDADAMTALYQSADVMLSLHRSEGFGLTLAEAMLHGLPVVATDWSGSTDFVTADTGIPVPYRLVPVRDPQLTYEQPNAVWAEADVAAAAAGLARLRQDVSLRHALGRRAAAYGREAWSADAYAAVVRRVLNVRT